MTREEKEKVFKKVEQRKERDKLVNKGEVVPFGNDAITIKALSWKACNDFDDALVEALTQLDPLIKSDFMKEGSEFSLADILKQISGLIRDDLPKILERGTNGHVTMDTIIDMGATRDDVLKAIATCLTCNYGYVKNLMTLTKGLK
jgi:hypothetical protein